MDTQNYKRTLAGSVGAGMGALMVLPVELTLFWSTRPLQSIIKRENPKKSLSTK